VQPLCGESVRYSPQRDVDGEQQREERAAKSGRPLSRCAHSEICLAHTQPTQVALVRVSRLASGPEVKPRSAGVVFIAKQNSNGKRIEPARAAQTRPLYSLR
jgi:hypothetical protein